MESERHLKRGSYYYYITIIIIIITPQCVLQTKGPSTERMVAMMTPYEAYSSSLPRLDMELSPWQHLPSTVEFIHISLDPTDKSLFIHWRFR